MFNAILASLIIFQAVPPQLYNLNFNQVDSNEGVNIGFVELVITPQNGYKWGTEYNAELKIKNNSNVILEKKYFSWKNKDFSFKGKSVVVKIPFEIKLMKDQIIRGKLSFLVCNKNHCLLQRNIKVKFKLISIPGC